MHCVQPAAAARWPSGSWSERAQSHDAGVSCMRFTSAACILVSGFAAGFGTRPLWCLDGVRPRTAKLHFLKHVPYRDSLSVTRVCTVY